MSVANEKEAVTKAADIPRAQMGELGFTGLKVLAGVVHEEMKRELQFPNSVITFEQMSYDSTIASALKYYEHMMLKSNPVIKPHKLANEQEKEYANFIEECFDDMDHSFRDFMQEASSMNKHGFALHEIVLRKRLNSAGSKCNDGKVGIKRLPLRGHDTILKWLYTKDGRDIEAVEQQIVVPQGNKIPIPNNVLNGQKQILPMSKCLLFRLGKYKNNPIGESPLKACFFAWKFKLATEELEGTGLHRDLSGVPIAEIPAAYLAENASEEQQLAAAEWRKLVANLNVNMQAGAVLPSDRDEKGNKLFNLQLLKNDGGKAYDTEKIKQYYVNAILTALSADHLILGQSSTGSYALGTMKGTLAALAIEAKLQEIADVINQKLIPIIAQRNGWNMTRLPSVSFEDLEATSLEELSKFIQRVGSVGYLPKTVPVINKALQSIGVDSLADDADLTEVLPDNTSRSSDGMAKGSGNGTSDEVANTDNSSANMDNIA